MAMDGTDRGPRAWAGVLLGAVLLSLSLALAPVPARAAGGDYTCYLLYSDTQANKEWVDALAYGNNSNNAWQQRLASDAGGTQLVYLAKRETEGFQLWFHERGAVGGRGRDLSVSVDPLVGPGGATMKPTLYREAYFKAQGVTDYRLADALLPYGGEAVATTVGESETFYVELRSAADQPAGEYASTVTVRDGGEVLATLPVRAVVWDFALPEAHYASAVMGLYNASSGYRATSGFLRASGVRFDAAGEVVPQDVARAESVVEAWQELLLEHGVSSYELPRWLVDADPKAAQLAMADPRRKAFSVPLLDRASDGTALTGDAARATVERYRELVAGNAYLEGKAFFYPADEQDWSAGVPTYYKNLLSALGRAWPGFHAVVPLASYNGTNVAALRAAGVDILCLNQSALAGSAAARADFTDGSWQRTWRYPGDITLGDLYLYRWGKSTRGAFRRILLWQQDLLGAGGILSWNCAYLPVDASGNAWDVWSTGTLPRSGETTGNGDGLLVYPSPDGSGTPVASLRLKQLASGMDDHDYLQLAREFLGEDSEVLRAARRSVLWYADEGIDRIWSSEANMAWAAWDVTSINNARIALGNALSQAAASGGLAHEWGAWETVVEPDADHHGLRVRTCERCGAQESAEIERVAPDLAEAEVTVDAAGLVYSGAEQRPAVTVRLAGAVLVEGADYTLSYADNVDAGTARVTVTGVGAYMGTATATFEIAPAPIARTVVDVTWARRRGCFIVIVPTRVRVTDGGTVLEDGVDFTWASGGTDTRGTSHVIVTGMGNYAGTVTVRRPASVPGPVLGPIARLPIEEAPIAAPPIARLSIEEAPIAAPPIGARLLDVA